MNIANDMVGSQDIYHQHIKHLDDPTHMNYVLSEYSKSITMYLTFYTYGINGRETFGLSEEDVKELVKDRLAMINEAEKYINAAYEKHVAYAYNTGNPETI